MLTYQITRFIHATIRSNKLLHIVETLLEESHQNESLLDDLILQFKRFLRKGNDEIFEENRLKYVTYLDDFNIHLADIKDLSKHDTIRINTLLLEIYEIPKKRNNLFAGLLIYFYLRNHKHLKGKALFKIIYLYFLIITYRNRLDDRARAQIINLDKINLRPVKVILTTTLHRFQKKYHLPSSRSITTIGIFLLVAVLSLVSWRYLPITSLQADISSVAQTMGEENNKLFAGKVAMDSLLLGRLTDVASTTLQGFELQNILIIALLAIIFQSLRTGFTNLFVNSFLVKTFAVIGTFLKFIFRTIFSVYNYVIYKLSTRYIFSSIDLVIRKNILPGPVLMSGFLFVYFLIYVSVIAAYFGLASIFFTINLSIWYIVGIVILLSILLIGINLHADVANFRTFLLEIDSIFKGLHEGADGKTKA